jgi:hypothetical protein
VCGSSGVPDRTAHMRSEIRAAGYSPETLREAAAGSPEPRSVGTPCRAAGALFRGRQRARRPGFPIKWGTRGRTVVASVGPSTLRAQAVLSPFGRAPRNRRGGVRMSRS